MKKPLFVSVVALVVAGGCKKSEKAADHTPTPGSGSATGSGSAAVATGSGSAVAEAPKPDPAQLERGAYLAGMLGCPFCHMPMGPKGPDFSRPFAGGMEVPEEFGTWRAPNITPHKGSGSASGRTSRSSRRSARAYAPTAASCSRSCRTSTTTG